MGFCRGGFLLVALARALFLSLEVHGMGINWVYDFTTWTDVCE